MILFLRLTIKFVKLNKNLLNVYQANIKLNSQIINLIFDKNTLKK